MSKSHEIAPKDRVQNFPKDVSQLDEYCRKRVMLDHGTMYVPGVKMGLESKPESVNGMYGIAQVDYINKDVVAVLGFNIEGDSMVISHTPQGRKPNEMDKKSRARLRGREFRGKMISQAILLAKELGCLRVMGVLAKDYSNVKAEIADYYDVSEKVDAVFERMGFEYDENENLFVLSV